MSDAANGWVRKGQGGGCLLGQVASGRQPQEVQMKDEGGRQVSKGAVTSGNNLERFC